MSRQLAKLERTSCFYLYVWLLIEPCLIYHDHNYGTFIAYQAFSANWEFLKGSLSYPCGIVKYIGGLLSQLYYFSWLGALIATAIAFSLYAATKAIIRLSAGRTLKFICYIPPVMLLILHNRYDSQLISFIALLAALWFTAAYEKLSLRRSAAKVAVFLVMFALLYYIAGGASFVFALLAMIYELFVAQRKILSVLFLTITIGVYLAIRYIFVDLETEIMSLPLFGSPLGYDTRLIVICVYFFFPLVLFVVGLQQALAGKTVSVSRPKKRARRKSLIVGKLQRLFQNNKVNWAIKSALPAAVLVVSISVSFDGTKRKLMQVDYFAYRQMWPEVLRTARRIRPELYDDFCIHDINRALYYTGRFGDEMFCYPQSLSALLLTNISTKALSGKVLMKNSRFFWELGLIGSAEKDAFEFLEIVGNTPFVLEQLAKIKLVKGQVKTAKVFLKALSKDLIYGRRGREMLRRLEDDPELANDKTIQYMRSVANEKDSVSFRLEADGFFRQLLDKNKTNKMAFEYMMAFYLLTGQTGKIVENISYFKEMGYEKLPQHYEEAIVIYIMGTGGKDIDLHGWKLKPETITRCGEFSNTYALNKNNIQNARNALVSNFGKSYFFYYIFERPQIIK
jgi:hypothetical protein